MKTNYKNEKLVQNAKSFRMLYETVKTLKSSKGFYGRLYDELEYKINNDKEGFRNFLNYNILPVFNDNVDVIMYLEG